MANDTHTHQETDAKAAFMGLIVGAIVLFIIVRGIVWVTNNKFVHEKSAVESAK